MNGWRATSGGRRAVLRWLLRGALLCLVLDLFYLSLTWPAWDRLTAGPIPKSAFMYEYERQRSRDGALPRLRWQPVALSAIPGHLQRAAIVGEDSRFYEHSGFDLIAFKEAMDYNLAEGRLAMGASTISQQTVKNLFLSQARTPLRKWHELILTWGMESRLHKSRILEIYLNIAEFGPGLYGVQAAAQAYWGINAADLDVRQAAELIAALPSPGRNNPATRTAQFEKRAARILRLLARFSGDLSQGSVPGQHEPALDVDDPEDAAADDSPPPECEDDCAAQGREPDPPASELLGPDDVALDARA